MVIRLAAWRANTPGRYMSATSAPGSSNVPGVTARTRTASRKSGFSAGQRHDRGVAIVRARLRLGIRQLAQPRHARHVATAQPPGDLPARRQPVLHHGAVRLAVLRLALQQQHEHRVLLQVVEVERLAVQCLELPRDPHLRPRRRQAASPERRSPTPPATPACPPDCAQRPARRARPSARQPAAVRCHPARCAPGCAVAAEHRRGRGCP